MSKKQHIAATINAALKNGDTTRPIIGRDAYAPKNGNGTAAGKTLTQLVKEAREAAEDSAKSARSADHMSDCAIKSEVAAAHSARTAKWCAAIAAASAIISIITAAI